MITFIKKEYKINIATMNIACNAFNKTILCNKITEPESFSKHGDFKTVIYNASAILLAYPNNQRKRISQFFHLSSNA